MRVFRQADDRLLALALAAAAAAVLFFKLGQGPLLDFDEATYAEIAREIGVYHDFVHLHFNFTPWLNKAPLYPWLTALLYQLFGAGEVTARAISAASGAAVVGLTYLVGRTWLDRLTAAGAALMLLLSNLWVRAARFGTSDVLLTFFIYLGIYGYLRARRDLRWWYLVGAAWGLAFMTKDIASLVGPAAVAAALVLDRELAMLKRPEPYLALVLAVVIALPWHIAVYMWQGAAFLQQYLGYMVVARAQAQIEGHTGGVSYYAIWSGIGFYPWTFAAVAGFVPHVLVDLRRRRTSAVLALLTVIVLGLYTAVRSKLYWYIEPLLPAYALFAAAGIGWAVRRREPEMLGLVAVIAIAGIWVTPNTVPAPPLWAQVGLTVLVGAGGLAALLWNRRPAPLVVASLAAFTVASAITVAPLYDLPAQVGPALGVPARAGDAEELILYVAPVLTPDDDVAHSLTFYSHRDVVTVVGTDQLKQEVPCGTRRLAVLDAAALPTLPSGYTFHEQAAWFRFRLGEIKAGC